MIKNAASRPPLIHSFFLVDLLNLFRTLAFVIDFCASWTIHWGQYQMSHFSTQSGWKTRTAWRVKGVGCVFVPDTTSGCRLSFHSAGQKAEEEEQASCPNCNRNHGAFLLFLILSHQFFVFCLNRCRLLCSYLISSLRPFAESMVLQGKRRKTRMTESRTQTTPCQTSASGPIFFCTKIGEWSAISNLIL